MFDLDPARTCQLAPACRRYLLALPPVIQVNPLMIEDAITVWLGVKEGNEHSREYVQGKRIYEWVMRSFFFFFFHAPADGEK